MIFLKTDEFLLKENSASINVVVGRELLDVFTAGPHCPAVKLVHLLVREVNEGGGKQDESEPEATVTHEAEIVIIVHWVVGS